MKHNPDRYSSQVGEVWAHFMFKIKYCHKIFDNFGYRNACHGLYIKACKNYGIRIKDDAIGFDDNHVHSMIGMGIMSKPEITKKIKGFIARKFFKLFPELKRPKAEGGLFWDSGLWSPASYGATPENVTLTQNYILSQKYGARRDQAKQYRLTLFCD